MRLGLCVATHLPTRSYPCVHRAGGMDLNQSGASCQRIAAERCSVEIQSGISLRLRAMYRSQSDGRCCAMLGAQPNPLRVPQVAAPVSPSRPRPFFLGQHADTFTGLLSSRRQGISQTHGVSLDVESCFSCCVVVAFFRSSRSPSPPSSSPSTFSFYGVIRR